MAVSVLAGGQDFLALEYRRNPEAGDLVYEIESSGNLIDWSVVNGTVLVEGRDNGDGSVTDLRRLPTAVNAAEEVFLRLRVSLR